MEYLVCAEKWTNDKRNIVHRTTNRKIRKRTKNKNWFA